MGVQHAAMVCGVDVVRVCSVLQVCLDQLTVLEHITQHSYSRSQVEADISEVMEQHRAAEDHLKAVREGQMKTELSVALQELHRSHRQLNQTLEDSPLSQESLSKVQRDRQFVVQVITETLAELQEKGTFNSLIQAVEEENERKAHLQDIIIREEEGRLRTKALQRELVDVRKEKTLELQKREEMMAHLKDQLQEMKVKTSLEKEYVNNSTKLLVYQGQKLNSQQEAELENEIRLLQEKLEEEMRVYMEMESFLKSYQTSLGEKLEYWMERYEKDMEDKQQELTTLKANKANNLAQLQELAKKYRQSEQVIIEDRLQKENLRKRMEKEQLERKAATQIQSWWRGTLVRKGLGPYKKSKKPKT